MKTQVTVRILIFRLSPIHASVIYQFPWIRWIHWNPVLFRENSIASVRKWMIFCSTSRSLLLSIFLVADRFALVVALSFLCSNFRRLRGLKNGIVSFYDCRLNGQDTQKWWRHWNSTCYNRNNWIVVRIWKSWLLAIIYYSFDFVGSAFYLCRLTSSGFRSALFMCMCKMQRGMAMYGSLSTLYSYLARIQRHLPRSFLCHHAF